MKTRSEKKYVDLVISMIMSSDVDNNEKEKRLKMFFNDHSSYYETFCYNTYYLTLLSGTNVLTIDEFGVSYVNIETKKPEKTYYDVLTLNDFSPCCYDVITHIDIALNHLYDLIRENKLTKKS